MPSPGVDPMTLSQDGMRKVAEFPLSARILRFSAADRSVLLLNNLSSDPRSRPDASHDSWER